MRIKDIKYVFVFVFCISIARAQQVVITANTDQNKQVVSPYIYGCNNSFDKSAQFYKDAGLRISRVNQGNNATKYNWRKKISSHPGWYNNVYANDWDAKSLKIAKENTDTQVMWAFQLLGRVASNTKNKFNDWAYNNSQWWQGVGQNLAGGRLPNEAKPDGKALAEGDIDLYTEEWPADSTIEIFNHWFGSKGIGLNKNQFLYWNMDNEPDVWNGTHDDVMSDGLLPASEFMDRYIEVVKKARALFPEIKICGPVTTSGWQWYKWGNESIKINGKYYCWLEYFIKRCADEEKDSDMRVLDVVDYISHLETFGNNGVEYFTPWNWFDGMWEALHLFSRYAKANSVSSVSSNENIVLAYMTVTESADSITIMLVNRDMNSSRNITINLNGTEVKDGDYPTLQLSSLS